MTPNFQEKAREFALNVEHYSGVLTREKWVELFAQALRLSYLDGLRRGAEIVKKHGGCSIEDVTICKQILAEVEKVEKEMENGR